VVHGKPADKQNGIFQNPIADNSANVVSGVSHMKPINNILELFPFILQMDHIRLGKDRTPAGHIGWFLTPKTEHDKISQYPVGLVLGNLCLFAVKGGA
jgi:hypothetical protein